MKKAPQWGKAIGIIMICLGALGSFIQFYKLILPFMSKLMPEIMDQALAQNSQMTDLEVQNLKRLKEMFKLSESEGNTMVILGVTGLILIVFYIIGGAKLLTPKANNYNFCRISLILFVTYNLVAVFILFSNYNNILFMGMGMYAIFGLIIDIVLLVLLLTRDKKPYGIGENTEMTAYTLDANSEDII